MGRAQKPIEKANVTGAVLCRACDKFTKLKGKVCSNCGAPRPQVHDPSEKIFRGETPEVLKVLPLKPPGKGGGVRRLG